MSLVVAMVWVTLAFGASVAQAGKTVDSFWPLTTGTGALGGQFNTPTDVAVHESTGQVYVADRSNNRVSRFSSAGEFERAWGVDVVDGVANPGAAGDTGTGSAAGFEICTVAAHCKAGISSGGNAGDDLRNGSLSTPPGLAVNQGTGDVYVRDRTNRRVSQYTADGVFVRSWGLDVVASGPGNRTVDRNERQSVALTGAFDLSCFCPLPVSDGTFTLSFDPDGGGALPAETTGAIPYDAAANVVQQRLVDDLASVASGDVIVGGGPGPNASWTVEFTGAYAGVDVAPMTANGTSLEPAGSGVLVSTTLAGGSFPGFEICEAAIDICKAGASGTGAGHFSSSPGSVNSGGGIAVSPVDGHVFVADQGSNLVATAGARRILEFAPAGDFERGFGWGALDGSAAFQVCTTSCAPTPGGNGPENGRFNATFPSVLAVGDDGVVYASDSAGSNRVQRLDSTATAAVDVLLPPLDVSSITSTASTATAGLAFDQANDRLLVARSSASLGVFEIDPAAETLADTHIAGSGLVPTGIGFDTTRDRLLATSTSASAHRVYVADDDGAGGALVADIDQPTDVTVHAASFSGTVNPGGFPVTASFQLSKDGVNYEDVGTPQNLGDGLADVPITGSSTTLEANTLYRLRISATRGFGNGTVNTIPILFLTPPAAPEVETGVALGRTDTSAFVTAQINPNGEATTYRFEYGTTSAYGASAPLPDASAGSGGLVQEFRQTLSSLKPNTVYHYRVVATNSQGTTFGNDRTVTTRPSISPDALGRAFELVSPADKFGGTGVGEWYRGVGSMGHSGVAAHDGERFAVQSHFGAVLLGDPAFSFANDWALAERTGDQAGWQSHSPLTHPTQREALATFHSLGATTPGLSGLKWDANKTPAFFPGMEQGNADLPADRPGWNNFSAGLLSDWGAPPSSPTRWELFGPDELSLIAGDRTMTIGDKLWDVKFSDDGSAAVGTTNLGDQVPRRLPLVAGLAGPGDPTFPDWSASPPDLGALESGRLIYRSDLSGGLSDRLEIGERELVNVCTGRRGVDRTVLPAVDGGVVSGLECPDPLAGDQERLVSPLGAAPKVGDASNGSLAGTVSQNGSLTFFMSPDPLATGAPDGTSAFCSGTGETTVCPPQLYVRQDDGDGGATVRWISKAEDGLFGTQAPSLTGAVRFEGASKDGRRVFFRTNSPLTADDPNGGSPVPGGVTTGAASDSSWDLYMYELPGAGTDIADGFLTRISGGPAGAGDCNSPLRPSTGVDNGEVGALRFVSADGSRAYFTCAAPLPGVAAPGNGAITVPGGDQTTSDQTNLYLHDLGRPADERWRFVARLPRATNPGQTISANSINVCATTGTVPQSPISSSGQESDLLLEKGANSNCVRGTEDGGFVTFLTTGRLTADDPPSPASGDVYGYDVERDELVRISAAQGGAGGVYPCATNAATPVCHGDGGVDQQGSLATGGTVNVALGVATRPLVAGDRLAFFQSRSRLVDEDRNDSYDVYQWRNGRLSLVSAGGSGSDHAIYRGNDVTGRNVYFATRDRVSWQDHDAVADIYTARVGGGIVQPPAAPVCDVLAHGCQGGGFDSVSSDTKTQSSFESDNAKAEARKTLAVSRLSKKARRKASRTGRVPVKVRASSAGRVSLTVKAKVGKKVRRVGRASKRAVKGRAMTVNVRLSSAVKKRLRSGKKLRLTVQVRQSGARTRTRSILLPGVKR
jgi:hypothetical protein